MPRSAIALRIACALRTARAERGQDAVAETLDDAATVFRDRAGDGVVMIIQNVPPGVVSDR
jgi:hypothetical protein